MSKYKDTLSQALRNAAIGKPPFQASEMMELVAILERKPALAKVIELEKLSSSGAVHAPLQDQ